MDSLANLSLLETLLALLPGFLTAEIVGLLVLRAERTTLERVSQALIYTFLAHVLWGLIGSWFPATTRASLMGLGVCAVFWGLLFTWMINTGSVHAFFRWCGITQAASRPNEWYDAFYEKQQYVILHLQDGRRLLGWPRLYPCRPEKGHILLESAQWLDRPDRAAPGPYVDILVDVVDVQFVEFLPSKEQGKENV